MSTQGVNIPGLPAGVVPLLGSELIPVWQNGKTVYVPLSNIGGGANNKTFIGPGSYNIPDSENGYWYNNLGAAGVVQMNLPVAKAGLEYGFLCLAAQIYEIVCQLGDEAFFYNQHTSFGGTITASVVAAAFRIRAVGPNQWFTTSLVGSWALT